MQYLYTMIKLENQFAVKKAIPYLPLRLMRCLAMYCDRERYRAEHITEIRLRAGGAFSFTLTSESIIPLDNGEPIICTGDEVEECVSLLCRRSYQSHETEIEQGYISVPGGIRAGVAVSRSPDGRVHTVNSVCIRIPRDVRGDVGPIFSDGVESALIYSPPGVGKTTVLRLCIRKLCEMGMRVSVIDTRYELSDQSACILADYICGCERGAGIECALRALSPQVIICDEIGSASEANAILETVNCGVPFIATAHAASAEELFLRTGFALLKDHGVFKKYIGLERKNGKFIYSISR